MCHKSVLVDVFNTLLCSLDLILYFFFHLPSCLLHRAKSQKELTLISDVINVKFSSNRLNYWICNAMDLVLYLISKKIFFLERITFKVNSQTEKLVDPLKWYFSLRKQDNYSYNLSFICFLVFVSIYYLKPSCILHTI